MKYTKDDLAKMSDSTINGAICNLSAYAKNKLMFDFNEWNDIMPLAIEHEIITLKQYRNWWAICVKGTDVDWAIEFDIHAEDESPQRAIACCLILVLQEQQQ